MNRIISILAVLIIFGSCKTQQKSNEITSNSPTEITSETDSPSIDVEHRELDTMVISAPRMEEYDQSTIQEEKTYALATYNQSPIRTNDLIHTKLDLRFNWEEEQVIGTATLDFKPFFYDTDQLVLDAKNFELHKVAFSNSKEPLKYDYDGNLLTIKLGKKFSKEETYSIVIEYTANPTATGGSAAITSDQGLFFINPRGDDGDKPQQIWTQGETEWNSRWFPTIDKPNERCTQEISLTVADRFVTLSNGLLVNSSKNTDGTRTDYWKMDQPHAPYLFMLAVGEFAKVQDKWKDIAVDYYVEPEYKEDARAIFSNTVEMLDFFSEKLGIKYPWSKYAQIVVRDYVSGAMENTTSVIFGEFVQRHSRELIDNNNEKIIAHELFHHWFGDYVTCESWANLTMNEGFANYSEYLWLEHKYGVAEADYHLLSEWNGYLGSARSGVHPLIHFGHNDKEDMFDAHSYNKGGAVLHMLRQYVGDDAFWAALNKYLNENAYQAVEAHDLRLAFEAVTGKDLNWFFNQWYFDQGHPELNVSKTYDAESKELVLTVEQLQSPDRGPAIFQLPVKVDIYEANGTKKTENIWIDQRIQDFSFQLKGKPALVNFDADKALLAEIEYEKSLDELTFQYKNAPKFYDRFEALNGLRASDGEEAQLVLNSALDDKFWAIRGLALSACDDSEDVIKKLRKLGADDSHSYIRSLALDKLAELEDTNSKDIAIRAIEKDSAYHVIASGLYLLYAIDQTEALAYAEKLQDEKNPDIMELLELLFSESGDPKYLPFFEKNLGEVDGYTALSFISSYQVLAAEAGIESANKLADQLHTIAIDLSESPWRKVASTKSLHDMRTSYKEQRASLPDGEKDEALDTIITKIDTIIEKIKSIEKDEQIKALYDQMN